MQQNYCGRTGQLPWPKNKKSQMQDLKFVLHFYLCIYLTCILCITNNNMAYDSPVKRIMSILWKYFSVYDYNYTIGRYLIIMFFYY